MEFDVTYLVIGFGILFVVTLILMNVKGNAIGKAVKSCRVTHDVAPVIAAIDEDKTVDVPTVYNSAIKSLWDAYDRETAAKLIKALVERNDTAPISQFWLKTVMDVEPDIARKTLGNDFIQSHYNEGIASKCGGCGGSCKKCKSCNG